MQRRLVEELKELEENIQLIKDYVSKHEDKWDKNNQNGNHFENISAIQKYTSNIVFILHKLLSSADKSFEVVFKGKEYNFIYPTTINEIKEMSELRSDLITKILSECYCDMSRGFDSWWMVTAFASGVDTLDMQIEIVKEDVTNRVDENGQRITALPLDMDNYQIEMQRPEMEDVIKNQALDL